MHMRILVTILCLLPMAWSATAAAQIVAENPTFKVGDSWSSLITQSGSNTISKTIRQNVIEITAEGDLILSGNNRLDSSLNPGIPGHPEYSRKLYQFPMQVGSKWSYTNSINPQWEDTGNFEVVGFEPITVIAGTFNCFHIQGEIKSGGLHQNHWDRIETWYCPEIKRVAKRIEKITVTESYMPGSYNLKTIELAAFSDTP